MFPGVGAPQEVLQATRGTAASAVAESWREAAGMTTRSFALGAVLVAGAMLTAACGEGDGTQSSALGAASLDEEQARQVALTECAGKDRNHGECVSCATQALDRLKKEGVISGAQKGSVTSWFAHNGCAPACTPQTTCEALGETCGTFEDGCGGWTECGCAAGLVCVAGRCEIFGEPVDQIRVPRRLLHVVHRLDETAAKESLPQAVTPSARRPQASSPSASFGIFMFSPS